jgi:hypothetical protein
MYNVYFSITAFVLNILSAGQILFRVFMWRTPSARKDPYYKDLDKEYYLSLGNTSWFTLKLTIKGKKWWSSADRCYYIYDKANLKEVKITFGNPSNCFRKCEPV